MHLLIYAYIELFRNGIFSLVYSNTHEQDGLMPFEEGVKTSREIYTILF